MAVGLAVHALARYCFRASALFNGFAFFNYYNAFFAAFSEHFNCCKNARRAGAHYCNVVFFHNTSHAFRFNIGAFGICKNICTHKISCPALHWTEERLAACYSYIIAYLILLVKLKTLCYIILKIN